MRLNARSEIATGRGWLDEARADIDEAARYGRNVVDPQFVGPFSRAMADLALWEGEPERARDAVKTGLEALVDSEEYGDPLWLCYLGIRAEADLAATDRSSPERARELLARARRLAVAGRIPNPPYPRCGRNRRGRVPAFGARRGPNFMAAGGGDVARYRASLRGRVLPV